MAAYPSDGACALISDTIEAEVQLPEGSSALCKRVAQRFPTLWSNRVIREVQHLQPRPAIQQLAQRPCSPVANHVVRQIQHHQ